MAKTFNITGEILLRGPANVTDVSRKIKKSLSGITADVKIRLDKATNTRLKATTKNLNALAAALGTVQARAASAAAAMNTFTTAANAATGRTVALNAKVASSGKAVNNTTKQFQTATTEIGEFGRVSALAVRRFLAFSIPAGIVVSLVTAIKRGVQAGVQFERELIKVSQVTGTAMQHLTGLTSEITRLSTAWGVSSQELLEVSRILAQTGMSARDTTVALEALALSTLAPTFTDIKNTAEGAVAAMAQFGKRADDLKGILGSINAVAGQFAVESDDIIFALRRAGGAFQAAGGNIEQLIALFTSVRSTTRETAETIATGFRTIFTRLQRVRTIDFLENLGIQLRDAENKFIGPYQAILKVGEALSKLPSTDPLFAQIVEELGGFRQVSKVIPLIQQTTKAQEALKVALGGTNSLTKDAQTAQQALAIEVAKVREEFLALFREITQSDAFKQLAKFMLGLARNAIDMVSAFQPLLPILASIAGFKAVKFGAQFGTGFLFGLKKLQSATTTMAAAAATATGAGAAAAGGRTARAATSTIHIQRNTRELQANTAAIRQLTIAMRQRIGQSAMAAGFHGPMRRTYTPRFATGGEVYGTGTQDTVPAMLTPGEFVVKKSAVEAFGIENLRKVNTYSEGGIVGRMKDKKRTDDSKIYKLPSGRQLGLSETSNLVLGRASSDAKAIRREIQDRRLPLIETEQGVFKKLAEGGEVSAAAERYISRPSDSPVSVDLAKPEAEETTTRQIDTTTLQIRSLSDIVRKLAITDNKKLRELAAIAKKNRQAALTDRQVVSLLKLPHPQTKADREISKSYTRVGGDSSIDVGDRVSSLVRIDQGNEQRIGHMFVRNVTNQTFSRHAVQQTPEFPVAPTIPVQQTVDYNSQYAHLSGMSRLKKLTHKPVRLVDVDAETKDIKRIESTIDDIDSRKRTINLLLKDHTNSLHTRRLLRFATGGHVQKLASGGVPVALTPGEISLYPSTVNKYGLPLLKRLNKFHKFQTGGSVVPGVGNTDSYYTTLPSGSFVIQKKAVEAMPADLVDKLIHGRPISLTARHSGGQVQALATGGSVGTPTPIPFATGGFAGGILPITSGLEREHRREFIKFVNANRTLIDSTKNLATAMKVFKGNIDKGSNTTNSLAQAEKAVKVTNRKSFFNRDVLFGAKDSSYYGTRKTYSPISNTYKGIVSGIHNRQEARAFRAGFTDRESYVNAGRERKDRFNSRILTAAFVGQMALGTLGRAEDRTTSFGAAMTGAASAGLAGGITGGFVAGPWGAAVGAATGAIYGWIKEVDAFEKRIAQEKFTTSLDFLSKKIQKFQAGKLEPEKLDTAIKDFAKSSREASVALEKPTSKSFWNIYKDAIGERITDLLTWTDRTPKERLKNAQLGASRRELSERKARFPGASQAAEDIFETISKKFRITTEAGLRSKLGEADFTQLVKNLGLDAVKLEDLIPGQDIDIPQLKEGKKILADLLKGFAVDQKMLDAQNALVQRLNAVSIEANNFSRVILELESAFNTTAIAANKLRTETVAGLAVGGGIQQAGRGFVGQTRQIEQRTLDPNAFRTFITNLGNQLGTEGAKAGRRLAALNQAEVLLPEILKEVKIELGRGLKGGKAPETIIEEKLKSGLEVLGYNIDLVSKVSSDVALTYKEGGDKLDESIKDGADLVKIAAERMKKLIYPLLEPMNSELDLRKQYAGQLLSTFDQLSRVDSIILEKRKALAQKQAAYAQAQIDKRIRRGVKLTPQEEIAAATEPFRRTQNVLAGGLVRDPFNVAEIGASLRRLTAEIDATQERQRQLSQQNVFSAEYERTGERLRQLNSDYSRLSQAMQNLANDTTAVSAAQRRLERLETARQARFSLAERIATADPKQLAQINMEMYAARLADVMGGIARLPLEFRQAAVAGLRSLGENRLQSGRKASEVLEQSLQTFVGLLTNPHVVRELPKKSRIEPPLINLERDEAERNFLERVIDANLQRNIAAQTDLIGIANLQLNQLQDISNHTLVMMRQNRSAIVPVNRNTGGVVPGKGNRDTVPAMLTPGEYVLRKTAVQQIGIENLQRLNKGGPVRSIKDLSYDELKTKDTPIQILREMYPEATKGIEDERLRTAAMMFRFNARAKSLPKDVKELSYYKHGFDIERDAEGKYQLATSLESYSAIGKGRREASHKKYLADVKKSREEYAKWQEEKKKERAALEARIKSYEAEVEEKKRRRAIIRKSQEEVRAVKEAGYTNARTREVSAIASGLFGGIAEPVTRAKDTVVGGVNTVALGAVLGVRKAAEAVGAKGDEYYQEQLEKKFKASYQSIPEVGRVFNPAQLARDRFINQRVSPLVAREEEEMRNARRQGDTGLATSMKVANVTRDIATEAAITFGADKALTVGKALAPAALRTELALQKTGKVTTPFGGAGTAYGIRSTGKLKEFKSIADADIGAGLKRIGKFLTRENKPQIVPRQPTQLEEFGRVVRDRGRGMQAYNEKFADVSTQAAAITRQTYRVPQAGRGARAGFQSFRHERFAPRPRGATFPSGAQQYDYAQIPNKFQEYIVEPVREKALDFFGKRAGKKIAKQIEKRARKTAVQQRVPDAIKFRDIAEEGRRTADVTQQKLATEFSEDVAAAKSVADTKPVVSRGQAKVESVRKQLDVERAKLDADVKYFQEQGEKIPAPLQRQAQRHFTKRQLELEERGETLSRLEESYLSPQERFKRRVLELDKAARQKEQERLKALAEWRFQNAGRLEKIEAAKKAGRPTTPEEAVQSILIKGRGADVASIPQAEQQVLQAALGQGKTAQEIAHKIQNMSLVTTQRIIDIGKDIFQGRRGINFDIFLGKGGLWEDIALKFAKGGQVPGTGNRDSVPAMLTPGEFVLKKSIVQQLGLQNLQRLGRGGWVTIERTDWALDKPKHDDLLKLFGKFKIPVADPDSFTHDELDRLLSRADVHYDHDEYTRRPDAIYYLINRLKALFNRTVPPGLSEPDRFKTGEIRHNLPGRGKYPHYLNDALRYMNVLATEKPSLLKVDNPSIEIDTLKDLATFRKIAEKRVFAGNIWQPPWGNMLGFTTPDVLSSKSKEAYWNKLGDERTRELAFNYNREKTALGAKIAQPVVQAKPKKKDKKKTADELKKEFVTGVIAKSKEFEKKIKDPQVNFVMQGGGDYVGTTDTLTTGAVAGLAQRGLALKAADPKKRRRLDKGIKRWIGIGSEDLWKSFQLKKIPTAQQIMPVIMDAAFAMGEAAQEGRFLPPWKHPKHKWDLTNLKNEQRLKVAKKPSAQDLYFAKLLLPENTFRQYTKLRSLADKTKPDNKKAQFDKQKFAVGGFVPGVGDTDKVPALLTPGEFVVSKRAAQAIGFPELERMNKMRRMATGGPVGRPTTGAGDAATVEFDASFAPSVSMFNSAVTAFGNNVNLFVSTLSSAFAHNIQLFSESVAKIPESITLVGTHNVIVNVTGVEQLEPMVRQVVLDSLEKTTSKTRLASSFEGEARLDNMV